MARRNQSQAVTPAQTVFVLADWKAEVAAAVRDAVSASSKVFSLVLAARQNKVEDKVVRSTLIEALTAAGVSAGTAKVRASEAMTVYGFEGDVDALPHNLQHAAAAVRKAKAAQKGQPTSTKAPKAPDVHSQKIEAVAKLAAAVEALRGLATTDAALELISDLADIASELMQVSEFKGPMTALKKAMAERAA